MCFSGTEACIEEGSGQSDYEEVSRVTVRAVACSMHIFPPEVAIPDEGSASGECWWRGCGSGLSPAKA